MKKKLSSGEPLKHDWLSRKEQLDILDELKNGATMTELAVKYAVPHSHITKWYSKRIAEIISMGKSPETSVKFNTNTPQYYEKEKDMYEEIPNYTWETLSQSEQEFYLQTKKEKDV